MGVEDEWAANVIVEGTRIRSVRANPTSQRDMTPDEALGTTRANGFAPVNTQVPFP